MRHMLAKQAAAIAVVPMLLLAAPAPGAAGTTTDRAGGEVVVRPRALPKGATPAISWLASNVVHTPNGRAHELPWTERRALNRALHLYGRTPSGWVVTDHELGVGSTGWVVAGDTKRALDQDSENNDQHLWMVARDGSALLKREGPVRVTRISDGATLGDGDFSGSGVYDFSGPQALLGVDGDTVLWEPGGDSAALGTVAVAGDLLHDVLVVPGSTPGTVGPTTISDPGMPVWSAPLEYVEVSPDGRFLLGRVSGGDNAENHLQVRRLSDGQVVAAFDVRNLWRLTTQWEGPRSIIFLAGRTGLGEVKALVRCRLDGTCNRATAWRELRWIDTVPAPQVSG